MLVPALCHPFPLFLEEASGFMPELYKDLDLY